MQLNTLTIKQAGQMLANKEITSVELTKACLKRIKEVDEKIKACLTVCEREALAEAKKADDSTRAALEQAGRDLLISLRQEIIAMLERLIKSDLRQALSPEELAKIIGFLIKNAPLSLGSQIIVSLSQQDKDKLESGMLKQLVEETKKSVVLKSAEGLDSGFIISFDDGKSIFDFSGQALTDYISGSLRPELNKILNAK